jgi:ribosome biogenesis GTPase
MFGNPVPLCQIAGMELEALGFDQWFADHARQQCGPAPCIARVTAVDRGRYLVRDEFGELPAELTGRYVHEAQDPTALPCVGDWVDVQHLDDRTHAIIRDVLPRRSFLKRRAPGRGAEFQMIAANIDVAFIVQACHFDFNVRRLERYLVMVREGHIEPVLLLTKTDLVSDEALEIMIESVRRAGIHDRLIALSSVSGAGIDELHQLLARGRTYCFLGSSGVGKTTLIKCLATDETLRTQSVSHTGEGRHTTTRRQLVALEGGGLLIDMPGMRELGMLAMSDGLDATFADIGAIAAGCRFADCAHGEEPGCAVRAAIGRGEISEEQLRSYAKLRKESAFHEMSYVDRRRKDRAFGRLVRSVLKDKADRDRGRR